MRLVLILGCLTMVVPSLLANDNLVPHEGRGLKARHERSHLRGNLHRGRGHDMAAILARFDAVDKAKFDELRSAVHAAASKDDRKLSMEAFRKFMDEMRLKYPPPP